MRVRRLRHSSCGGGVRVLMLGALLLLPALLPAQACRDYFSRDDPRLFEFLETRAAVDYPQFEGLTIGQLDIVVLPVFNPNDPDENNWLYRFANKLHIDTRDATVREQLTLKTGAPLDVALLQENERLLRANSYLIDAMILPARVCQDRLDLLVVVRDVWTLLPSASVGRAGGDTRSDVGLSEDNLLGTGRSLAVGYFSDRDRSGFSAGYRDEQLFGNHTQLRLNYADNTDGQLVSGALVRPFYTLDTPWSAGGSFHDELREESIRENDVVVNRFDHEIRTEQIHYGRLIGHRDNRVRRWVMGLTRDEDLFTPLTDQPAPTDRTLIYPWLAYRSLSDQFWSTANIAQGHRHEDLGLGLRWGARIGYADTAWESSEDAYIFNGSVSYGQVLLERHLLRLSGFAGGRFNRAQSRLLSTLSGTEAHYQFLIDERNRWAAQVSFDAGVNLEEDEELTSGGANLRGYPNEFQRGNRRWLATIERRHFTNWHLFGLVWLGGAAYIDAGRTWNTDRAPGEADTNTLVNAGLGLRLTPSKFRTDRVLHLDVAAPLTERDRVDDFQFIVAGRVSF